MSDFDARLEQGSLAGHTDVPLLTNPLLRGTVRRHDPDGGHAAPYFAGLSGQSLRVFVGNGPGITGQLASITINFASDDYQAVVSAVNAVSPTHIRWKESDGFAGIECVHAGEKFWMSIGSASTAGALTALGYKAYPSPGAFSRAGDFASAPSNRSQANPTGTKLLSKDESLSTSSINRAIIGMLEGIGARLSDLDKPIVVYRDYPMTISAVPFTVDNSLFVTGDITDKLSIKALTNPLSLAPLQKSIAVMYDSGPKVVPLYSTSGDPVFVEFVSYGRSETVDPTDQSVTWGSPPVNPAAKLGEDVAQSMKIALTAITKIEGNVITATGAGFNTNLVSPGDVITIQNATNNTPFNHNGEFVILSILNANSIVVRPLGQNEDLVDTSEDRPRALNQELPPATSYGDVGVYVGWGIPLAGPSSTAADRIYFKLSVNANFDLPEAPILRLPIVTTLRQALVDDLLASTDFLADPTVAKTSLLNVFNKSNTFTDGVVLKPRAAPEEDAQVKTEIGPSDDLELLWEVTDPLDAAVVCVRLYSQKTGGKFLLTSNAKYSTSGTNWVADDTLPGLQSTVLEIGREEITSRSFPSDQSPTNPTTVNFSFPMTNAVPNLARMKVPISDTATTNSLHLFLEQMGPDQGGGSRYGSRIYGVGKAGVASTGFLYTTNAKFDDATGLWTKDIAGQNAARFYFSSDGISWKYRKSATSGTWDDANGWDGVASTLIGAAGVVFTRDYLPYPVAGFIQNRPGADLNATILLMQSSGQSTEFVRVYVRNELIIVSANARWSNQDGLWVSDAAGEMYLTIVGGGTFSLYRENAPSGSFLVDDPSVSPWSETFLDSKPYQNFLNGYLDMIESGSAPAAPGATKGRLFMKDNGIASPGRKSQLCIKWPDNTITVIAESPAS